MKPVSSHITDARQASERAEVCLDNARKVGSEAEASQFYSEAAVWAAIANMHASIAVARAVENNGGPL